MPYKQCGPGADVFDEVDQHSHYVVVARQAVGCRPAHARQIQVEPPVPRHRNDRFDRRSEVAMINGGAVQRHERHTVAVLDVVKSNSVDLVIHSLPLSLCRRRR
jgi:hypothetical protein